MVAMDKNQAELLLAWYRQNERPLPWRKDADPYRVLVSETMLQQTRIEAVKPYYERFLQTFPSIQDLAKASEEEVLKLWQGLGYYSRARNLRKAAILICSSYGGIMPQETASLSRLPGVGEYTRNAILSIAFQKPFIAVDGNLLRVYARLSGKRFSEITVVLKRDAGSFFSKAFPLSAPGDYNQALMDLGELICVPTGSPLCEECPLASSCVAHRLGNEESYPGKRTKKEKKSWDVDVFLLEMNGRFAIEKREDKGLLAGLYQFPNIPERTSRKKREKWLQERGLILCEETPLGEAKHVFTHLIWNMRGFRIRVQGKARGLLFLSPKEIREGYSIPSAFSYYLKQLD